MSASCSESRLLTQYYFKAFLMTIRRPVLQLSWQHHGDGGSAWLRVTQDTCPVPGEQGPVLLAKRSVRAEIRGTQRRRPATALLGPRCLAQLCLRVVRARVVKQTFKRELSLSLEMRSRRLALQREQTPHLITSC